VPGSLWASWSPEPLVVVALVATAGLHVRGVRAVWARAGHGRVVGPRQVLAFHAGLAVVAVALVSPLDGLAAALFSAHMVQHLLLTLVAAPLLVVGASRLPFARALPPPARRRVGRLERRLLGGPARTPRVGLLVVAVLAHTVTFWLWHSAAMYEAAVRHGWAHALEHTTMLGAALLLWWAVLAAAQRGAVLAAVLALFAVSAQEVALAALITLAPEPWYGVYAATAEAWGVSPLADQQVAGSLMWTFGAVVYIGTAVVLLARRLDAPSGSTAPVLRPPHVVRPGAPG
jgi:putative membrane protein